MIVKLMQTKTDVAEKEGYDKDFTFKEELNIMV